MGIVVNRQVKGKTLAKRIIAWTEHVKHSKNRQLPEVGEGERSEEKGREGHLGAAEAPACATQRSTLCED
jgi:large subunit ribosomal protein L21e